MTDAVELSVGGLVPLSTVDFPGALAAVVFCQGCPWRCTYCHNPHLWPLAGKQGLSWQGVRDFLLRRRGLLDGVVFSGGEPTWQEGLASALEDVRAMGFRTALHTGGSHPGRLAECLPLLDWVGLDIKAPPDEYARVTRVAGSGEAAARALEILRAGGVAFEVRTTAHPDHLPAQALRRLAKWLARQGIRRWTLQMARAVPEHAGAAPALDAGLLEELRQDVEDIRLRI